MTITSESGVVMTHKQTPNGLRLLCCVPGCDHSTSKTHYHEWICCRHWDLIPKHLQRRNRRLNTLIRRANKDPVRYPRSVAEKIYRLSDKNWEAMKASISGGAPSQSLNAFLKEMNLK